jgi:flagellar hook assembly protein FlgD
MVKLNVLDINGKIIKNLVHQTKSAGRHQIIWEGRDRYSKPVASGVYLIVMETNGKAFVRKIMYIK